jgi:hypothetical protein
MFDPVTDDPRDNRKAAIRPTVEDSTEEKAQLIMRKLVDAYFTNPLRGIAYCERPRTIVMAFHVEHNSGDGRAEKAPADLVTDYWRRCSFCFGGAVPVIARYHAASDCARALAAARSDCD